MLEKLKPQDLWKHFEALTRIPRCSKHEEAAADYCVEVAKKNNLKWKRDAIGNVVVYKDGTKGHEKAPVTVLQGHVDIVCEKNSDVKHNFAKDPLKLRIVGDYLKATGTTLGADNGIGVAAGLALMEAKNVVHGPLEFLFTIDEETGLTGASNLNGKLLKGRRLLNLDTEEDGALYVGCAGGIDTTMKLRIARDKKMPRGYQTFNLKVLGLRGGHSGVDIHEQRGNANVLLSRLLHALVSEFGARIVTVSGGSKRNAIPRETEAVVALPKAKVGEAEKAIKRMGKTFKNELAGVDEKVKVVFKEAKGASWFPLTESSTNKAVTLFTAIPHGVAAMSLAVPGLVETSTNFAILTTTKGMIQIDTSQRSSVESQRSAIAARVAAIGRLSGASVQHSSAYPGWKPDMESDILKVCKDVFVKKFKKEPKIRAIHAGLECGILGSKVKGLDMVSIGPQIESPHSPDEQVHIGSVEKFWDYLLDILKALA